MSLSPSELSAAWAHLDPRWEGSDLTLTLGRLRASFVAGLLASAGHETWSEAERLHLARPDQAAFDQLAAALAPDLICLDVDGCLIHTAASFDGVVKTLVARYTGRWPEDAELLAVRRLGGYNDDNLLAFELIRRAGVERPLELIFPEFRELYFGTADSPGLYRRETPLIRADLMRRLRERGPVALVTGRNSEELRLALDLLDLPADLPAWTIDDVAAGKPDPEGILAAKARFAARSVWMVGDNVDDILAARNAGAVALGVGRYCEALTEAGAALVLDDINQLEDLL